MKDKKSHIRKKKTVILHKILFLYFDVTNMMTTH